MKFYANNSKGYSLVEVLIAISILLVTIVGPLTIAQKGLKNATYAKQQNTAFFLAQEALEAVVKIREDQALEAYVASKDDRNTAFDYWEDVEALGKDSGGNDICTSVDPCGFDIENDMTPFLCSEQTCDLFIVDNGRTRYQHDNSGEPTVYRREVILDSDGDRIRAQATVSWGDREDQKLTLETFVYNIYAN